MNISILSYKRLIDNGIPDSPVTGEKGIVPAENTNNSYMFNKGVLTQDTFISSNSSPSFTSVNPAMADLRKYANDFRCAYTGLRMISFNAYKFLLKLASKPHKTDKGIINQVGKYHEVMDGVELEIFKFYKHKLNSNKNLTIKDVTEEQFPKSYNNLKIKYLKIINKLRSLTKEINNEKVQKRYNATLDGWEEDLLKGDYLSAINLNKYPQILQKMKYGTNSKSIKYLINETLQKLPSSTSDFDAFIVKSRDASKKQFINRLISPFIVTIEHVRAKRNGGHANSLSNCILVRSRENCGKSDTPLDVMLAKHPDRIKHIKEYYQHVIEKINNGGMKDYLWYPFEIKKTLETEARSKLLLDDSALKISKEDAYRSFTV